MLQKVCIFCNILVYFVHISACMNVFRGKQAIMGQVFA